MLSKKQQTKTRWLEETIAARLRQGEGGFETCSDTKLNRMAKLALKRIDSCKLANLGYENTTDTKKFTESR